MLGIIGALDPHSHKLNQADLQGEGKLEAEGVRPQRPPSYQPAGEPRPVGEAPRRLLGKRVCSSLGAFSRGFVIASLSSWWMCRCNRHFCRRTNESSKAGNLPKGGQTLEFC